MIVLGRFNIYIYIYLFLCFMKILEVFLFISKHFLLLIINFIIFYRIILCLDPKDHRCFCSLLIVYGKSHNNSPDLLNLMKICMFFLYYYIYKLFSNFFFLQTFGHVRCSLFLSFWYLPFQL